MKNGYVWLEEDKRKIKKYIFFIYFFLKKITCSVCGFHAKINPAYTVLVDFGATYLTYRPDENDTSIALTL